MGHPFDPLLASFYKRLSRLAFELEFFFIAQYDDQLDGLSYYNNFHRRDWPEPFHSLFIFGGEEAVGGRLATVPWLADVQGFQPVVGFHAYDLDLALPVASTVDNFFNTYARHLEIIFTTPEFRDNWEMRPLFPWDVPELIAGDRKLVEMLREGRFDSLMFVSGWKAEQSHTEVRRWRDRVLAANP